MDSKRKRLLQELQSLPGNSACVHCSAKDPDWASVTLGTTLCLQCSGVHRSFGVHISFVRSITLDDWTEEQREMMRKGGNAAFLEACPDRDYFSEAAELYRRRLKAIVCGGEPVTTLTKQELLHLAQGREQHQQQQKGMIQLSEPPAWTPDMSAKHCEHCRIKFTLLNRRHHCRSCGRLVCGACAPANNTKPLPKFGITKPVRHCVQCYQSPLLNS
eukprot:m.177304 g.177304  ORF g.177304 m.177304 type:complete len:216 (-) comp16570_c13_seq4:3325-3972(-)